MTKKELIDKIEVILDEVDMIRAKFDRGIEDLNDVYKALSDLPQEESEIEDSIPEEEKI